MLRVQEAAKALRLFPKLPLGEMRTNERGNKVFHPDGLKHIVKITAEPTTTMIAKNNKPVKAFKFIVDQGGNLYKWLVPLTNDSGEGHYLIDRLNSMNVQLGEEIVLEMKKRGPKNYIDISRPGEEGEDEEVGAPAEEEMPEIV